MSSVARPASSGEQVWDRSGTRYRLWFPHRGRAGDRDPKRHASDGTAFLPVPGAGDHAQVPGRSSGSVAAAGDVRWQRPPERRRRTMAPPPILRATRSAGWTGSFVAPPDHDHPAGAGWLYLEHGIVPCEAGVVDLRGKATLEGRCSEELSPLVAMLWPGGQVPAPSGRLAWLRRQAR